MDGVKDIVPQLLEAIRESYKSNVNRNILLQKLINIIKDNKGDYETLLKVSKEYGIALSDAFKSNVTGDILPDGKMYYNIAERLLNELLRENYDNVAPLCETVQSELNKQNGINLKAVKPSYKQEKVNGLIDYISGVDYEQREASFLDALITNSKSIVDDSVKENCEFQANCGMSPVIQRITVGKTCKWCANLAGTYQYPNELPDDVYKRHANCDCIVIYKPDKHTKDFQNVWSKKWNDVESRKRISSENKKLEILNLKSNNVIERLIALSNSETQVRPMAMGLRKPAAHILDDKEIKQILKHAESIGVPNTVLDFNKGTRTSFNEAKMKINIRGDIFPDNHSRIARDIMSPRAVLAHEYYGHYLNHPSPYQYNDWRDEFRASYDAAVRTPNLTDEERAHLMIDAYDRAREAGEPQMYDEIARRIIYGY